MLLQQIVQIFDDELSRLQELRGIIAGLQKPSVMAEAVHLLAASRDGEAIPENKSAEGAKGKVAAPVPAEGGVHATRLRARMPRGPRAAKPPARSQPENSALRGSIPTGPVVVSAAQMRSKEEKAVAPTPKPQAPERGSLGSMIRALRLEPS